MSMTSVYLPFKTTNVILECLNSSRDNYEMHNANNYSCNIIYV